MNEFDIDKAYISPYDKMLKKFDQEHPLSESQLQEINKYKRINALRDAPANTNAENTAVFWEEF